jgi:hypothetical protein
MHPMLGAGNRECVCCRRATNYEVLRVMIGGGPSQNT